MEARSWTLPRCQSFAGRKLCLWVFQFGQQRLDGCLESGEIGFHCFPYLVQVHTKILVDQHVAHGHDLGPRNLRISGLKLPAELSSSLANDLNVVKDPDLDQLVLLECLFSAGRVSFDRRDGVEDVRRRSLGSLTGGGPRAARVRGCGA